MGLKINWKYVIIGVIILAAGFFAGRWTSETKIKTEYVKGETVTDTIYSERLVPYKVEVPAKPVLPMKPDTIKIPGQPQYITMKVDTAQIIAEFITKNSYNPTLFDNDTQGKLTVAAVVQYNKLQKLGYEFTPIQKQTTVEKKRVLTPFIMASYNSLNFAGAGAGIYYHDLGAGVKYITDFKVKGYEFSLHYKF